MSGSGRRRKGDANRGHHQEQQDTGVLETRHDDLLGVLGTSRGVSFVAGV